MYIALQVHVQFGMPTEDGVLYNIHFKNQVGHEWEVSHTAYQLARLDHLINSSSDILKTVYYPIGSKDILTRLKNRDKDANSSNEYTITNTTNKKKGSHESRVKRVEYFRTLLENWVNSIISNCHELDQSSLLICERFFGLPMGPTLDSPKYQFTNISKFDN